LIDISMNKTMMAVTFDAFKNLRVHLMLDANGHLVPGYYLGVMGCGSSTDDLEPFCLTPDGTLDVGPEGISFFRLSFPPVRLERGTACALHPAMPLSRTVKGRAVISNVEPVAPHGCRVVRVICDCLERDEDGEARDGLNFEIILDKNGSKLPDATGFGWKGLITAADARRPFMINERSTMDFGINTGRNYTRFPNLQFPDGPLKRGGTIRMNEDGDVSAYRIRNIVET
jgi:hypothetical protein